MKKTTRFRLTQVKAKNFLCVLALSLLAVITWPRSVLADNSITIDPQIRNLMDFLEKEVETWSTDGKSTRGASGYLSTLILSADTLACASWIVSFRDTLLKMQIDRAPDGVLQAMNNLKNRIVVACEPVLSPDVTSGNGGVNTKRTVEPTRTDCPECDKKRNLARQTKYEYDLKLYYFNLAVDETEYLEEEAKKKHKTDAADEYVKYWRYESSRHEGELGAALPKVKDKMDKAHKSLVACLERCLKTATGCDFDYKCSKICPGGMTGAILKLTCEEDQDRAIRACKDGRPYELEYECR